MEIVVEVKDVYGKPLVYPVSEEASLFAMIAESKTLTPRVLDIIEDLGFKIVERRSHLKEAREVI
jgi:hypothetical protein